MALAVVTGNIPANQSISGVFDCTTGTVVRLTMPVQWKDAPISFQVSVDNTTFYDLFDSNGREVLFSVQQGVAVTVLENRSISFAYLKIRSGSRERPVVQPIRSDFRLILHS